MKKRFQTFLSSFGKTNSQKSGKTIEGISYNPEKQYPVYRCSICTGEKVAGFKNRENGHFTEVMVIRSPRDEQVFQETYQLESVKTEY